VQQGNLGSLALSSITTQLHRLNKAQYNRTISRITAPLMLYLFLNKPACWLFKSLKGFNMNSPDSYRDETGGTIKTFIATLKGLNVCMYSPTTSWLL